MKYKGKGQYRQWQYSLPLDLPKHVTKAEQYVARYDNSEISDISANGFKSDKKWLYFDGDHEKVRDFIFFDAELDKESEVK